MRLLHSHKRIVGVSPTCALVVAVAEMRMVTLVLDVSVRRSSNVDGPVVGDVGGGGVFSRAYCIGAIHSRNASRTQDKTCIE